MTRLLALVVLAGCAGSDGLEAVEGVPFGLEVGEAAVFEGAEVRFVGVVEDSRCPTGVDCVWAGRARVRVAVDGSETVLSVPHAGSGGTTTAVVGGLEVAAQALTPYPAVEPSPDPVELTLVVFEAE